LEYKLIKHKKLMSKTIYHPKFLTEKKYISERLESNAGDPAYLHLSDLFLALKPTLSGCEGKLLDFGCGGSPYRALFSGPIYHRADIGSDLENIDFTIEADGSVGAANELGLAPLRRCYNG
jgi:hypothetical protein